MTDNEAIENLEYIKEMHGAYPNEVEACDRGIEAIKENPKKLKGVNIKCPKDLNRYLISEPLFENTFPAEECEMKKYYGDCYHCFASSIAKRDHERANMIPFSMTGTKRPKGKWIMNSDYPDRLICDKCNAKFDVWHWESKQMHYCPNCGSHNGGEEDEQDTVGD